jgi:predicted ester cyclase
MKNCQIAFIFSIVCYCSSCNSANKNGLSDTAQKNLDAMHGISTAIQTRDFNKLDRYIAADAVDHAGENGDIKGLDSIKLALAKEASGTKDDKMEIIKQLADDDFVMSWEHFTGMYATDGMGHKSGAKYDMKSIELVKFKDGKASDHWTMLEPRDLMKMEASMANPTPGADTLKKKNITVPVNP